MDVEGDGVLLQETSHQPPFGLRTLNRVWILTGSSLQPCLGSLCVSRGRGESTPVSPHKMRQKGPRGHPTSGPTGVDIERPITYKEGPKKGWGNVHEEP